jgi:hypothetical protein
MKTAKRKIVRRRQKLPPDACKPVGVSRIYKFYTARPHPSLDVTVLKCTNSTRT